MSERSGAETIIQTAGRLATGLWNELRPPRIREGWLEKREGQLFRRARVLALLLAAALLAGIGVDHLLLSGSVAFPLAGIRLAAATALVGLAVLAYRWQGLSRARILLFLLIGILGTAHLVALQWILEAPIPESTQLLYILSPVALLAGLAPFPLPPSEGGAFQVPVLLALVVGAFAVEPAWTLPVGVMGLMVGATALWSEHVQYHTFAHYIRESSIDGLTQIPNRAYIDRWMDNAVPPLSLLLLDVDHFKALNDEHGHDFGDEVLRSVSSVLQSAIREEDQVRTTEIGRYGGEEFLVVAARTDLAGARAMAERLRGLVERTASRQFGLPVTVSVGVAECSTTGDPAVALRRADAALYAAKEHGRNRVEHAEQEA